MKVIEAPEMTHVPRQDMSGQIRAILGGVRGEKPEVAVGALVGLTS